MKDFRTHVQIALEEQALQNDEYITYGSLDYDLTNPEEIAYFVMPFVAVNALIRLYLEDRDVREYIDLETSEHMVYVQEMLAPVPVPVAS
jgi:hypothetical protein